jgi:hypothetical protein
MPAGAQVKGLGPCPDTAVVDELGRHPTQHVAARDAEIDCGIAALIELLNDRGARTVYCCCGAEDAGVKAYIV